MTAIYDCSVDSQLLTGMRLARGAIGRGELVVIPTDTVYGIAADAFDAAAVARLLEAKGRERTSPPPVLIPGIPTLDALASEVPEPVRRLVGEFWPGGLTIILMAQPSLRWDLGETRGTVALRMPANPIALELLSETGPLAVSSANLSGRPSATTAADAAEMLGDSVAVYLDGGAAGAGYEAIGDRPGDTSSTIIDATGLTADGGVLRIVRAGVISRERIAAVVGEELLEPAASESSGASESRASESAGHPSRRDIRADRGIRVSCRRRRSGRRRLMTLFLALALVAALVTFGGSILVWKLSLKYRLYPKIRERDVHTRPTPRLGGVAMFVGILAAISAAAVLSTLGSTRFAILSIIFQNPGQMIAILGAALLIVLIGVADDIWDLDWTTKLAGQFIAAGLIAWQGVTIVSLPIGGITVVSSWMSAAITVFAIVLVMNAINFIDGLDGLVAGVALIANGTFFLYTYLLVQKTSPLNYFNLASLLAIVLVGACVGFLPLNWHPAKLFMGDAGALLIGLLMATSAIAVTGQINPGSIGGGELFPAFIPIILPFAVLVIPLLDFGLAVIRRLRAGKSPFAADRKHLHHRLLDMGHSHLNAVLILYAWTAVASIGCLLSFVFPVYFGISSWWAFILLGIGFLACTAITLAPLGRRKRLTVAAEADERPTDAAALDELEGVAHVASVVPLGRPAPDQDRPLESADPELEHDDRRTS